MTHSSKFTISLVLVAALIIINNLVLPTPPVQAADVAAIQGSDVPEGLASGEWHSIREMARQAEYQFAYHEADESQPAPYYWAPNRAQGWHVVFNSGGLELGPRSEGADWRWGLALHAYGYVGQLRPTSSTPTLSADADRLTIQWDEYLAEWYVNAASGLEHGFTLTQPPSTPTREALQIDLAVLGTLSPRTTGDGIDFEDSTGQAILRYDRLQVLDAMDRELSAHLQTVGGLIRITIDDANAVYPLTVDPLLTSQTVKLTASDGAASDLFGVSVSVSGDTLVVGAQGDETYQGAAYVFERNQGGADAWGQVAKLTASDGADWDRFGHGVSISGDTIVVGAHGNDVGGNSYQGAAYVFERDQGGADSWGQVAKLTASDGAADDWLGWSVSISNGTVVAGAPGDDSDQGAAYMFVRNQGGADSWGQVAKLTASDGAAGDRFGISVAVSGDTAVVGADGGTSYEGAAYIFERNWGGTADGWGQVTKLTADNGTAVDAFGFSVAISGDTVVIGAYYDDTGQGAAYVFGRNQGGADSWGQEAKLTASDGAALDYFGWSVSISGDDVIVGAHQGGSTPGPGAAYIFERNPGSAYSWGQMKKLTASDGVTGDQFGWSVSISGDTLVVGAQSDDSSRGAAYTFMRDGDAWLQEAHPAASDGAIDDYFGYSVSISGDTLVTGALGDDSEQGSAYVFARNQGGADSWGQVAKLTASDGAAGDRFGWSVSISGDTVVVGAPTDDSSRGSAYVFARNQGGADSWGQVAKLTASDGVANDYFARAVSISDDALVVGAYGDDSERGSAYVFRRHDAFAKSITGPGAYTFGGDNQVAMEITDDGGCLTSITVTLVITHHPNATMGLQTGRYWGITPTVCTSGFTTNLTLGTTFVPDANSKVCRYVGPGQLWDCAVDSHDVGQMTVTRYGVTDFSDWAAGDSVGPNDVSLHALSSQSDGIAVPLLAGTALVVLTIGGMALHLRRRGRL